MTPETEKTVPPEARKRKLAVRISLDAYARVHAESGRHSVSPGKIVNDLAVTHLPPADAPQ